MSSEQVPLNLRRHVGTSANSVAGVHKPARPLIEQTLEASLGQRAKRLHVGQPRVDVRDTSQPACHACLDSGHRLMSDGTTQPCVCPKLTRAPESRLPAG